MTDTWLEKFKREGAFMPFGSIMNAYGQMHQHSPVTITKFLKDVDKIFNKAVELKRGELLNSLPVEEIKGEDVDIPLKEEVKKEAQE